jgi:hypothetical protein
VSSEEKQQVGLANDADGEFWYDVKNIIDQPYTETLGILVILRMDFNDFIRNWHTLQICHLSVDCLGEELLNPDDVN